MRTQVAEFVARKARTAVLTGAGISAESGVPTFRGPGGLWQGNCPEDLATPEAFERDPVKVWSWYLWRREMVSGCHPNPAHLALAELETALPWFRLLTQNVDGLHRDAGSLQMVELHGSLWKVRCTADGHVEEDRRLSIEELPPRCECGALMRPHIVWFGEPLESEDLEQAFDAAAQAELFLVVGTSSIVQPAASLATAARDQGALVVEINLEPTPLTSVAQESHRGTAAELLPALLSGRECR